MVAVLVHKREVEEQAEAVLVVHPLTYHFNAFCMSKAFALAITNSPRRSRTAYRQPRELRPCVDMTGRRAKLVLMMQGKVNRERERQ